MSSLAAEIAESGDIPERAMCQRGLRLVSIRFERIREFKGHPFRLYTGERLADMVESIRQNGILMPLIVRRIFGDPEHDFEMLSGHNRMNAGKLAGLDSAWCLVKEGLTDEEALMYVIETNLLQRSFADLLPSEKAAVLALRYSEMFSQGKRNDIRRELAELENETCGTEFHKSAEGKTCGTGFHKSRNRDALGEDYDLSGRQVAKYLRIKGMCDGLKTKLDDDLLTLNAAVSLSYLCREEQLAVFTAMEQYPRKLSDTQAAGVRELAKTGPLTEQGVLDFLRTPKHSASASISIGHNVYSSYFAPGTSQKEVERVIGEALALYFSQIRGGSA